MDRRTFLKRTRATSGGVVLWSAWAQGASAEEAGLGAPASESGQAFNELLETLGELERSFRDPAGQLEGSADLAEARRHLAHVLQHALETQLEVDAAYPVFVRFVTPEKKLLGDNPDAIYYTTPVSAEHRYRIRGNLAGATYTSFTVERRNPAGGGSGGLAATLNDTQFVANADGSYEIAVSAQQQPGNWLRLDSGAMSITTRHYYEREVSIARDRLHHVPLVIEHTGRVMPRPAPDEASVAAGLRRASALIRAHVPRGRRGAARREPNQFPAPDPSVNEQGFAARDNVYVSAGFVLRPEQALVIRGRYPRCRFANVVLWNRFIQSLDYTTRQISLNRTQTTLEPDGSFKVVIAGSDPGVPNWLDTEGRTDGMVWWRFLLPEENIEPLISRVVPLSEVRSA